MDDLVTWLRAQLDEDERLIGSDSLCDTGWHWTDERFRAEVEAKRRILDLHAVEDDGGGGGPYCLNCHGDRGYSDRPMPCATVRLLALPYADRPGYREEWRP